ncbi:MAG: hypothetical protein QG602_204 [Verrucomicrobiota bacterium]|nr:hypothetical protein [Verrucomicrobiota bacterium]
MHSLLQHYGVDWLAMVLTFFGIYFLGSKQRRGFVIMMCGNACWIALACKLQTWGMVAANVVFFAMNVRGFVNWRPTSPAP